MPPTFTWNELATTDPGRARRFYTDVLGWTFEPFTLPGGEYWVARAGDAMVGGLGGLDTGPPGLTASTWVSWVGVDDVDEIVSRAVAAGGTIVEAPSDVPHVGRVAVLRDPTGALFGLMAPRPEPLE